MTANAKVIAAEIESLLDEVYGYVASLRAVVEAVAPGDGGRLPSAELGNLRSVVSTMVSAIPWTGGGGFVAALDSVDRDHRFWDWWTRSGDGRSIEQLHPPRTASGGAEYAYESMQWFRQGERGEASVFGPFVDFAGVNQLVILLAEPVMRGDRFLGVVGADLVVDSFEIQMVRRLREIPGRCVLVGTTGRVVASTVAAYAPGERFDSDGWASVDVDAGRASWKLFN